MNWEHINRGTLDIGGKRIYYRSNWEQNYCFYLEWLKEQGQIKDWEHEPQRYSFIDFKVNPPRAMGNGYLPDFKVINNDGTFYLIELKGYKQGLRKLKYMKKYHPDIKIELVEKRDYFALKNKVGKMLGFV